MRLLDGEHPEDDPAAHLDAVRANHLGDRAGDLMVVVLGRHRDERRIADRRVAGRPHLEPRQPARDRIAGVVHVLEPEIGGEIGGSFAFGRLADVKGRTKLNFTSVINVELGMRSQLADHVVRERYGTARNRCPPCRWCCRSDRWPCRRSWWRDTGSGSAHWSSCTSISRRCCLCR